MLCTTMESYSVEAEGILLPATNGRNLEDIVLSEISQSPNDKYFTTLLLWGIKSSQNY